MKKILFLNKYEPSGNRGGVEMTLKHLVLGLKSHGVEPVVLATGTAPGLHKEEVDGVVVWRTGIDNPYVRSGSHPRKLARLLWHAKDSYNLAARRPLAQVLEYERPDIVSVHNLSGWSVAAWRTISDAHIPIVHVLHDQYLLCANATMFREGRNCRQRCLKCRLLRVPHGRLSSRVAAVVGVSKFVLDRHIKFGYFEATPIRRIIHDARDVRMLGAQSRSIETMQRERLRFGFIGRLGPGKGIEPLLNAFARSPGLNAELWVAGGGSPAYVEGLRRRHECERVRFLGRVVQSDFFPEVDVVVVPSLWEDAFPGVIIEALAFGKPVIGSRRGGIPEIIRDGENGVLIDPDNEQELSAALRLFVDNSCGRRRMATGARQSARQFLDPDRWVSAFDELYSDVMIRTRLDAW
jgi:glycosyltransferase involved in cell wall biosynthesis